MQKSISQVLIEPSLGHIWFDGLQALVAFPWQPMIASYTISVVCFAISILFVQALEIFESNFVGGPTIELDCFGVISSLCGVVLARKSMPT